MSEYVAIPVKVWNNVLHDLEFIKKAILPLAKGYKAGKWMTEAEVMEYLQIGKSRLKQLRQSGKIDIQKPAHGRATEYLRSDIQDYKSGHLIIETKRKESITQ
jgi:hypothetical protein